MKPFRPSFRLTDQSLFVQFMVAGGGVALFSVISLFLLLNRVNHQSQASQAVARGHGVVEKLNTLGRDFFRQQTALRAYLKSGDLQSLAELRERRTFLEEDFKGLEGEFAGGAPGDLPGILADLSHIRSNYEQWRRYSDQLIASAGQAFDRRKDPSFGEDVMGQEASLFKQTFLLVDQLIDRQQKAVSVRDEREKQAVQNTFTVIAVITIALLLIVSIVLIKLYYSIARPIANLSQAIGAYRTGDFAARVTVSNSSEIGYLEASFNEMAERIEAMVSDLRKLDELKTDFLSTVSHELRTPLTSISGYVKLLLSGDTGEITPTQKEFLNIVDTNVVRLTNLINDLLDVEKIESGKIQLIKEPVDLARILKECRDTFDILAKQKGLALRYDVPAKGVTVLGDRSRLIQVFMNLISNAIKYTKEGFVEIALEEKDYAVMVRVTDSGVGLSPEDQEKLFQKFYRAKSALKSTEGGTGLGLVIVRGLIEAHNGKIMVESEVGRGTTFSVALPLGGETFADQEVEVRTEGIEVTPLLSVRYLWIVNENPADVKKIQNILDSSGEELKGWHIQIRSFKSIADMPRARRSLDESPSIVILDLDKSSAKGEESIQELREKIRTSVPILVLGDDVDAVKAFSFGAAALLTKPVRSNQFLLTLKNLLGSAGQRLLLADADPDIRLLLKRGLERRGFKVDDVDRGNAALMRLQREHYDGILIELNLPDLPGAELIRVVRNRLPADELPVFVMSDDRDGAAKGALEPYQIQGFFAKYRGIDAIVRSVKEHLEQVQERRRRETEDEEGEHDE